MKVTENGEGLTKSKFARYAGFNANMFFWGFPGGSAVKNLPAMQET